MWMSTTCRAAACVRTPAFYYVNPQERKPQAQRDWLDLLQGRAHPQERKPQAQRDWPDLLQGRAHNVHEVDVCALSFLRFYSILSPVVSPIFQLHNPFIM